MPRTSPVWPSAGVPISQVPPAMMIATLQAYRLGKHIPEVARAEDMIRFLAGEVERLGGELARESLFDTIGATPQGDSHANR